MKFKNLLAAAALVGVMAPAAASAQDIIQKLMDKTVEVYSGKGFSDTGFVRKGTMAQGETNTISIPLSGGSTFQVVGMCDTACGDLNLQILDSSGSVVDKDELADDFPIVSVSNSGTYTLRVSMVKCTGSCAYAIKAFKK